MKLSRQKRKIILSAEVLAEIPSKIPPPTRGDKLFWRVFIVFVVVAFTGVGIAMSNKSSMWICTTIGIVLGLTSAFVSDWVFAREYPLVFTTLGITAGPYINEFWEDIESFRLYDVQGLRRHTISKIGTGTTLALRNKGFCQRTIGRSGSVFPIQGYFFTEQQQAELRQVFLEHGIKEIA